MTFATSPIDEEMASSSSQQQQQHQQHKSLHSQYSLQQQLRISQHAQQTLQRNQSQGPLAEEAAGGLIPEGNADCMRFYKGPAVREHRQSTAAAAAAAAATRRTRRRWPQRRPRSRLVAPGDGWNLNRHSSCEKPDKSESPPNAGLQSQPCLDSYDQKLVARLKKTSTQDTHSSATSNASPRANSQENLMIDNCPVKMQFIFYKGQLQPVEVMKWPQQLRIPTNERYRLEEPMKRMFGKRSVLNRLIKALERSHRVAEAVDPTEIRLPIPLLPRHMTETTKRRLKLWYKPLESSGEFHAISSTV